LVAEAQDLGFSSFPFFCSSKTQLWKNKLKLNLVVTHIFMHTYPGLNSLEHLESHVPVQCSTGSKMKTK